MSFPEGDSQVNPDNIEPAKFNLNNPANLSKWLMTAQAEFLTAISELQEGIHTLTDISHSIDIELSDPEMLIKVDDIFYRYIASFQAIHMYYQSLLDIRNIPTPNYYPSES